MHCFQNLRMASKRMVNVSYDHQGLPFSMGNTYQDLQWMLESG
jgi:hypothetical protein